MGFLDHPFLETPAMDRLARKGAHLANAFVTTSLCSPSRATILTGHYAHVHLVVDNNNLVPEGTIFFPQYLQAAGYQTAFVGKWHMGGASDEPRPGFDRWVSFRGQGNYLPGRSGLNVDGRKVPQKGYITDELTAYALDWLGDVNADQPFFLYLSHKGVHADFVPAERHVGRYRDQEIVPPPTQAPTEENLRGKPRWVRDQRNSWHGVDFPYHSDLNIKEYYKRYCETLLAVDESIGRVLDQLDAMGQLEETLVIYLGDNGFAFGEHGLIDKRTAYEVSMRIPMLMHCPALIPAGSTVQGVAANLDIAPTVLDAAGLQSPESFNGFSLLPMVSGQTESVRDFLFYEYFWERNFPHTPTIHAIRTDQYKFIRYQGIWDTDELYDIQSDPVERVNLIAEPEYQRTVADLRDRLFTEMERTDGMEIRLYRDRGRSLNRRNANGSKPADFPERFVIEPNATSNR